GQRSEVRYVRGFQWARESFSDVFRRHMAVAVFFGLGTGTLSAFLPTFADALGVRSVALFYTGYAVAALGIRLVGGRLIDTAGRSSACSARFSSAARPAAPSPSDGSRTRWATRSRGRRSRPSSSSARS